MAVGSPQSLDIDVQPKSGNVRQMATPYLFLLPFLIVFTVFLVGPILYAAFVSLSSWQGGALAFRGFFQYQKLFADTEFWHSLLNVVVILVIQVPVMLILAAIFASLLNSKRLKFRAFFQLGFFVPILIDIVAYSLVFSFLLEKHGIINSILGVFGFPAINWLLHPIAAKVAIMIALTWHWTGYNVVILLGGMQGIPSEVYEAARVDGAGSIRQWWSITLPLLVPILVFESVLSTIGTLQLFVEPYILTSGGPDNATLTPVLYLYQVAFQQFHFGYASAVAFILAILIAILSFIQFRVARGGAAA
ncbi:MAG: sugar ABC transporter permease [Alicyclobacillaceae bacterium]|nr:sugar ABC transporter permease [Alicyclobacillaceae bacterium]MCY0896484.1 sugar ABC transporter permease [Alicyclobacillaceae bacterium]